MVIADEPERRSAGRARLAGGLRYLWTQLIATRTGLVLLLALALAAIPGSLLANAVWRR